MRPYQTRLCLRFAAVALGVGAAAVAVAGLVLPLEGGDGQRGEADRLPRPSQVVLPPLEQFEPLWTAELRGHALPVAVQKEVAQEDASVPLRLTGTLGRTQALVATPDGVLQAVSVGDSVNGIEIVEIGAGQMTVRYNGKLARVVKPPEPDPHVLLEGPEGGG